MTEIQPTFSGRWRRTIARFRRQRATSISTQAGRRVSEDASDVVVIRETDQSDHDPGTEQHGLGMHRVSAIAEREHAAVDVEPDDGVHHLLRNDVRGHVVRHAIDDVAHRLDAALFEHE